MRNIRTLTPLLTGAITAAGKMDLANNKTFCRRNNDSRFQRHNVTSAVILNACHPWRASRKSWQTQRNGPGQFDWQPRNFQGERSPCGKRRTPARDNAQAFAGKGLFFSSGRFSVPDPTRRMSFQTRSLRELSSRFGTLCAIYELCISTCGGVLHGEISFTILPTY